MPRKVLIATCLVPLLAACSAGQTPAARAPRAAPPPSTEPAARTRAGIRPPAPRTAQPIRVQSAPGLEGVIGASASELARRFGNPRLEVWEGDARKVQFSGPACVLDIYLYPPAPGAEPQASFAEARRASDGQDTNLAACVTALRKP